MLVFLTWTNLSALHWFRCEWRSAPVTGLRQVCQPRISKVGSLSLLHGVTSGCCLQEEKGCQFPLSRRRQRPASFGCVWARMDSLCAACVDMQRFTCGAPKQGGRCVCVHEHTLAPEVVTKEAEQNWSKCNFHFCYSEREEKKKNCHSQKLYPQLDFFF